MKKWTTMFWKIGRTGLRQDMWK